MTEPKPPDPPKERQATQPEGPKPPPPAATEVVKTLEPPEDKRGFPTHFARLFFGVITLLVLYYSYLVIKPFLVEIFLALVLFFVAKPLYLVLVRALRGWKVIASFLTCLILALVIVAPLGGLLSVVANQALEFSSQVSKGMASGQLWHWIETKIEGLKNLLVHWNLPLPASEINLEQIVQTVVTNASAFIYTNAVGLIKGFTVFVLDLVLVLFIAFFMFLQGDAFIDELRNLSPLDPAHNEEILRETENTIKATLWGTVIVAFVQGILGGIGFLIFGLPQPAFWGTVMIPASVIPVVGSAIIWGPAAIYLIVTGSIGAGVGLIIWGGVVVSMVDNILKPILIKGAHSTPTILVLFSILGGLDYFGIIGFIMGPLILSFLLSLLRIYQKTFLAHPTPTPIPAVPVRPPRSSLSKKRSKA